MGKSKINSKRRGFIKLCVLGGAGLCLGGYIGFLGETVKETSSLWPKNSPQFIPNAWLRIDEAGLITVKVNHSEMGQGITTALPMIVAEELDACWSKVSFKMACAESVYKNPAYGTQMTAGSTSICTSWDILRQAGASARQMLIRAASEIWQVPIAECQTKNSRVIHSPTKRTLDYGRLVKRASKLPVPKNPVLKDPKTFTLIGRDLPRLDLEDKINGKTVYGADVSLPGLLTAIVCHPPVLQDRLKTFDAKKALRKSGVKKVVELDGALAVVAETFWQASEAMDLVNIIWKEKGQNDLNSEALFDKWRALAERDDAKQVYEKGEAPKALDMASNTLKAQYEVPFQAHAAQETINCTAMVDKDFCRVWAPTQNQDMAQEVAAKITGFSYDQVEVITPQVGGAFGRRITVEYVEQAVKLALLMKAPVKVIWTREQDMKNDFYRPANLNVMKAGWDSKGNLTAWSHRLVGPDHMSYMLPLIMPGMLPYALPRTARDITGSAASALAKLFIAGKKITQGAAPLSYSCENVLVDYVEDDPGVPVGFWRSVGDSHNAYVVECFMDEIAKALKKDPVKMRLDLLNNDPRMQKVLKKAALNAGWKKTLSKKQGMGIACHNFHDTRVAMVTDLKVDENSVIKLRKMTCCVDCGIALNPRIIKAQIKSAVAFALSATLKSYITIKNGKVQQSDFDDFSIITLDEMPQVDVEIIKSDYPPSGIGEAGVPVVAPSVINAIFSATGKRLRHLPVFPKDLL